MNTTTNAVKHEPFCLPRPGETEPRMETFLTTPTTRTASRSSPGHVARDARSVGLRKSGGDPMDPASTSRSHDGSRCLGGRGYERRQRASQSFLAQTCLRRVAVPAVTTTSRDGDNHHMGGGL